MTENKDKGTVISCVGGLYTVRKPTGERLRARAKGAFRYEKSTPLAGDTVTLRREKDSFMIEKICERKNSLVRPPLANVDTLFVSFAAIDPVPNVLGIDKLLSVAAAATGKADGALMAYNFHAGEPVANAPLGAPLLVRAADKPLVLADFMKTQIYAALGSLSLGMRTLHAEGVELDDVCGHGGFFKAGALAQSAMSAALGAPVTVMENAGEGGAWGMALLALAAAEKTADVAKFLERIFENATRSTVSADETEKKSFVAFMERYQALLPVQRLAAEQINRKGE